MIFYFGFKKTITLSSNYCVVKSNIMETHSLNNQSTSVLDQDFDMAIDSIPSDNSQKWNVTSDHTQNEIMEGSPMPLSGRISSKFSTNVLDDLFSFLNKHKRSLIGFGDLAPADFNNYIEDDKKESNAVFFGHKYVTKERTYYEGCLIDGTEYKVFDHVVLALKPKYQHHYPNVARIIAFYEENSNKRATLEWYYRPIDILPIMRKIKETGRHPLIPVTEDPFDNSPGSKKKKRGRPPKKRLYHVEETINYLEASSESELFTSLRPYIDDVNVSIFERKCIVDYIQPTNTKDLTALPKDYFYYKKTLEFKICVLSSGKPRPSKPRLWIEQLEKKNKEIKIQTKRYSENFFNNIAMTSPKIMKTKDDIALHKEEAKLDYLSEHDSSNNISDHVPLIHSSNYLQENFADHELLYDHLTRGIEYICQCVPESLNRMEKKMEAINYEIHSTLEELMTNLNHNEHYTSIH